MAVLVEQRGVAVNVWHAQEVGFQCKRSLCVSSLPRLTGMQQLYAVALKHCRLPTPRHCAARAGVAVSKYVLLPSKNAITTRNCVFGFLLIEISSRRSKAAYKYLFRP